jgi:arginine N-succinyltransferase
MSAEVNALERDPARWQARRGTAADLEALRELDGAAPLPLAADESLWVAVLAHDGSHAAQNPAPSPAAGEAPAPQAALRLRRRIGQPQPHAGFRLGWAVHASAELGLYRRQRTLLLGNDLTGADELGGWALAPELAAAAADIVQTAWAALVAAALDDLDVDAARPCIAQLPGLRDAVGRSPVWQGLGRHFHADDPDAARRRHGAGWEHHVAPLLPRQLLYASLLPAAAQEALGQALPAAAPLRAALEAAGFGWRDHVGLVDGGPVLERWPGGR